MKAAVQQGAQQRARVAPAPGAGPAVPKGAKASSGAAQSAGLVAMGSAVGRAEVLRACEALPTNALAVSAGTPHVALRAPCCAARP